MTLVQIEGNTGRVLWRGKSKAKALEMAGMHWRPGINLQLWLRDVDRRVSEVRL